MTRRPCGRKSRSRPLPAAHQEHPLAGLQLQGGRWTAAASMQIRRPAGHRWARPAYTPECVNRGCQTACVILRPFGQHTTGTGACKREGTQERACVPAASGLWRRYGTSFRPEQNDHEPAHGRTQADQRNPQPPGKTGRLKAEHDTLLPGLHHAPHEVAVSPKDGHRSGVHRGARPRDNSPIERAVAARAPRSGPRPGPADPPRCGRTRPPRAPGPPAGRPRPSCARRCRTVIRWGWLRQSFRRWPG